VTPSRSAWDSRGPAAPVVPADDGTSFQQPRATAGHRETAESPPQALGGRDA